MTVWAIQASDTASLGGVEDGGGGWAVGGWWLHWRRAVAMKVWDVEAPDTASLGGKEESAGGRMAL